MDVIEQLVSLGNDVRIRTTMAVRNNQDVRLVQVSLNGDLAGEGLTYAEAMDAAFASLRSKAEKRLAQDTDLLAVLPVTATVDKSPTPLT